MGDRRAHAVVEVVVGQARADGHRGAAEGDGQRGCTGIGVDLGAVLGEQCHAARIDTRPTVDLRRHIDGDLVQHIDPGTGARVGGGRHGTGRHVGGDAGRRLGLDAELVAGGGLGAPQLGRDQERVARLVLVVADQVGRVRRADRGGRAAERTDRQRGTHGNHIGVDLRAVDRRQTQMRGAGQSGIDARGPGGAEDDVGRLGTGAGDGDRGQRAADGCRRGGTGGRDVRILQRRDDQRPAAAAQMVDGIDVGVDMVVDQVLRQRGRHRDGDTDAAERRGQGRGTDVGLDQRQVLGRNGHRGRAQGLAAVAGDEGPDVGADMVDRIGTGARPGDRDPGGLGVGDGDGGGHGRRQGDGVDALIAGGRDQQRAARIEVRVLDRGLHGHPLALGVGGVEHGVEDVEADLVVVVAVADQVGRQRDAHGGGGGELLADGQREAEGPDQRVDIGAVVGRDGHIAAGLDVAVADARAGVGVDDVDGNGAGTGDRDGHVLTRGEAERGGDRGRIDLGRLPGADQQRTGQLQIGHSADPRRDPIVDLVARKRRADADGEARVGAQGRDHGRGADGARDLGAVVGGHADGAGIDAGTGRAVDIRRHIGADQVRGPGAADGAGQTASAAAGQGDATGQRQRADVLRDVGIQGQRAAGGHLAVLDVGAGAGALARVVLGAADAIVGDGDADGRPDTIGAAHRHRCGHRDDG